MEKSSIVYICVGKERRIYKYSILLIMHFLNWFIKSKSKGKVSVNLLTDCPIQWLFQKWSSDSSNKVVTQRILLGLC